MKISLVVAAGVHQGKIIPVNVAEFRIGRDPDCQLRPSSPSISKQHCAIIQRGDSAFIRDFGSTNGTFVNNEQVAGERELQAGDYLKAGPLEFTLKLEGVAAPKPAPALAAVAAAPADPSFEDSDPDHLAMLMLSDGDGPAIGSSGTPTAENAIPDGSTVMELPAIAAGADKKDDKKSKGFNADTSGAAASILSKYMRRPRT